MNANLERTTPSNWWRGPFFYPWMVHGSSRSGKEGTLVNDTVVTITIRVTKEGYFCNASLPGIDGSEKGRAFVCNTIQPTPDLAIAGAMPFIRQYAELAKNRIHRRSRQVQVDRDNDTNADGPWNPI